MCFQKLPYHITPMPTCSINIQPDRVTAKPVIKVLQHLEKTFSITAFCLDHPSEAQKRGNPARNVQSFLMLAGCRNLQAFANECPSAAKSRMQGKAAFILKHNRFFRTQRFEFFLGSWLTSSHPQLLLGDKHDWPALAGIRVDASNTELAGLSALSRTVAVNVLPALVRPNGLDSSHTSGAILPVGVPTGPRFSVSSGPGAQTVFSESGLRHRPYLPRVSSGLHSSGSGRGLRKSTRVVALPAQAGGWRSSCQSRPPALFRPGPITALLMPFEGLMGRYSCLSV